jgi:head-tail adaptor
VASLTRTTTVATVTTVEPHGYTTGDFVTIAGATPAGYNGKVKITVTGASSFTYPVNSALATPPTGALTVVYVSDAQGGRKVGWEPLDAAPIWAELLAIRTMERLQAQALTSQVDYRFRTRVRTDITAQMRALWTPSWTSAPQHTLEIRGVVPWEDGRTFMVLECGELVP